MPKHAASSPRLHVHVSTQAKGTATFVLHPRIHPSRFTGPSLGRTQLSNRSTCGGHDVWASTRLLQPPLDTASSSLSFSPASPAQIRRTRHPPPIAPRTALHAATARYNARLAWSRPPRPLPYLLTLILLCPTPQTHSTLQKPSSAVDAPSPLQNGGSRGPPAHLHAHGPCLGEGRHHLRVWQCGEPDRVPRPLFGPGFQPPRRG